MVHLNSMYLWVEGEDRVFFEAEKCEEAFQNEI